MTDLLLEPLEFFFLLLPVVLNLFLCLTSCILDSLRSVYIGQFVAILTTGWWLSYILWLAQCQYTERPINDIVSSLTDLAVQSSAHPALPVIV